MRLVLYGSFSCPYSYLASLRADRLAEIGSATVEWRAVVHNPDIAPGGRPVEGEVAETFGGEISEIRELLMPGERYPARLPAVESDTTAAVAGFSTLEGQPADQLRRALFEAVWVDGLNIGERAVLEELGCPPAASTGRSRTWQEQWEGTDRHLVPMMLLPDAKVSRGLGALKRLADMLADVPAASDGGDPSCWAHLVCEECGGVVSDGHKAGCASA